MDRLWKNGDGERIKQREKDERPSKKKTLTKYGIISISRDHLFCKHGKRGFNVSPRMQEMIVYAGQETCYEKGSEMIKQMTGIEVSETQIYRITDSVSSGLEEDSSRILPPLKSDDYLYVEVDGSMVQTREEGWKEVKLGRIFKSSDCMNYADKESYIGQSQYVSHFGNSSDFCKKIETVIDSYNEKQRFIFISDGACWIRNWIEDSYSESISILDFYHACEHLYDFAGSHFKDPTEKNVWSQNQKDLLLDSRVSEVIENIRKLECCVSEKQQNLIDYFQSNTKRMDYKYYRTLGVGFIGSGAIESAHRTLIQKRMKLSGQHWSKTGVKNMLKIRTINLNKSWYKVINFLKIAV